MPSSKHNQLPDTRTPVYIDILPELSSWPSLSSRSRAPPSSLLKSPRAATAFHPSSNAPRRMRDIDPTVTFVSPSVIIGKSSYIILLDGAPIHSEDTKLECIGPYFTNSINPSDGGPLLYSTALVPKYWEILCKSPDPTIYTIIQDVYHPAPLGSSSGRPRPILIFSAEYHFRYSVSVCKLPSSTSPYFAYQANSPFITNIARASYDLPQSNCSHNRLSMPPTLSDQESLQSHEDSMQNQQCKHYIPDINLGDFSLVEAMINNHDSSDATYKEMMAWSSFSSFLKRHP
ncbi:hypothetical protein DEU56DRAFT_893061 [Suillus clintonianus]|uniref:uncharacterized protein n=1 Tax=Suillus clintonianus TaxID=1904413 RepID=UPI001B878B04|nr:uncharacterized protein DEU56DRAFT_893061 [Suillus clintonianus]KAG2124619.1 hypothetical protein DEU56DRAFT_893061 [Suillus clintonianus]